MCLDSMSIDISKIKMQYSIDKQSAPSLPHHSEELEAWRCHANLETTRQRASLSMTRVQGSSS